MNREELGELDLNMTYEGPAVELESTAMTQSGAERMNRHTMGGPCTISFSVEPQSDKQTRKLHEILDSLDTGLVVIRYPARDRIRTEKQLAPTNSGPRNKWGGLK